MQIRRRVIPATILAAVSLATFALPTGPVHAGGAPAVASFDLAGTARGTLTALAIANMSGDLAALLDFGAQRSALATTVASIYGVDPARLSAAWAAADQEHQVALLSAIGQIGVRYRTLGGSPETGFDCSGLTSWAWAQAGRTIAHQSRTQINAAAARTGLTAMPGDLVFYPGHAMMFVGEGLMVHSPQRGKTVEIDDLPSRSLRFGDPT
jgi:cell wall-associated NlpC family hydrolase